METRKLQQLCNCDPPVFSVDSFCRAHDITRSFFYSLVKQGLAPRIMKVGRRTLVSREAAADWRARMEIKRP